MAALKMVKQAAFIQVPTNAADTTSGMQPAASSSAIGKTETVDGTMVPGQDIGKTSGASYLRATT